LYFTESELTDSAYSRIYGRLPIPRTYVPIGAPSRAAYYGEWNWSRLTSSIGDWASSTPRRVLVFDRYFRTRRGRCPGCLLYILLLEIIFSNAWCHLPVLCLLFFILLPRHSWLRQRSVWLPLLYSNFVLVFLKFPPSVLRDMKSRAFFFCNYGNHLEENFGNGIYSSICGGTWCYTRIVEKTCET